MNDITIKTFEYRACYVNGKKALFHKWCENAQPLEPSALAFGHKGGQLWHTLGLIEYEDGTVKFVDPFCIKFCDNLMKQYYFKEDNHEFVDKKSE